MRPFLASGCAAGLALALSAVTAFAQDAPSATQTACASAEYRQFDFWLGKWEVANPDGSPAGSSLIERILGGCVLQENWSGAGGMSGKSYNIYDQKRRQWHQTWVDDRGSLLQLDGRFDGKRMVLSARATNREGKPVIQRITWEPTGPSEVRQLWEQSADEGKSWKVMFDGRYRRKG